MEESRDLSATSCSSSYSM